VHSAAVHIHHVLLVTAVVQLLLPLKNQLPPIGREVRLGVVAAEGELPNVAQMALAGSRGRRRSRAAPGGNRQHCGRWKQ
jgi:hypothetical protein